ncbi:unnamed protein product [Ectocarpus sp. 4 AP-2014]
MSRRALSSLDFSTKSPRPTAPWSSTFFSVFPRGPSQPLRFLQHRRVPEPCFGVPLIESFSYLFFVVIPLSLLYTTKYIMLPQTFGRLHFGTVRFPSRVGVGDKRCTACNEVGGECTIVTSQRRAEKHETRPNK